MSEYRTLTGREVDTSSLNSKQRKTFELLLELHKLGMARKDFSNRHQAELKKALPKLDPDERFKHPLYRIAEDLEMRLGIAQGLIAPPDYRDYIAEAIEEKYGSRYKFCKETGVSQSLLSQVFAGKKDLSLSKLKEIADLLGLKLVLMPLKEAENHLAYS